MIVLGKHLIASANDFRHVTHLYRDLVGGKDQDRDYNLYTNQREQKDIKGKIIYRLTSSSKT